MVKKVVLNNARLLSVGSYIVVVGEAHGHHIDKALLTCSCTTKHSFGNASQLLCSLGTAGQLPVIENQEIRFTKGLKSGTESG